MEWIEQLDRSLFLWVNGHHSPIFDQVMWQISGKLQWIPFYLILLFFVYKKFGKQTWIILGSVAVLIILSDQISVRLFKDVFQRYRPCHNLELKEIVHLVNNKCGGTFGFVSSHATNSFALASFIGLCLNRKALLGLLFWATIISFSRVYLGVHYPLDVFVGALLGIVLAIVLYSSMNKLFKKQMKSYV